MKNYRYYSRLCNDGDKLGSVVETSRLRAANHFANRKQLQLKDFLRLFKVSK